MLEEWEPKTELGKLVKEGKISDIREIFRKRIPILEPEIVDYLLPNLKEEVVELNLVQRMHKSGRKTNYRVSVVVGNEDGIVGIGSAVAKEVGAAIRKAVKVAKLNVIQIRRGCGSFECSCKDPHSIPFRVEGKCGSVRVVLIPAPRGTGLVIGDRAKKVLKLAGIKDIWSQTFGHTKTEWNFVAATFDALKKLSLIKINEKFVKEIGMEW